MNYCICDQDGIITNIIVADSAKRAGQMGALPSYDGARIGEKYVLPADAEEKTRRIQQSKTDLAAYLESHPIFWTDGEYYSITQEKQAQLTSTLVCAQADGEPPEWNSTGGVCRKWDTQELTALGIAIKNRVKALVKYQQTQEVAIRQAATREELDAIKVDYDSVKETEV